MFLCLKKKEKKKMKENIFSVTLGSNTNKNYFFKRDVIPKFTHAFFLAVCCIMYMRNTFITDKSIFLTIFFMSVLKLYKAILCTL